MFDAEIIALEAHAGLDVHLLRRLESAYPDLYAVWAAVDDVLAMAEDRSEIEGLQDDLELAQGNLDEMRDRGAQIAALADVMARMGRPDKGMAADVARLAREAVEWADV